LSSSAARASSSSAAAPPPMVKAVEISRSPNTGLRTCTSGNTPTTRPSRSAYK
jgi:hypothetical protein